MTKELTLNERLQRYFSQRPDLFINGGEIERLALDVGYKGSTASRIMRKLAEEGYLEREERKNGRSGIRSVWYKWRAYL